MSEVKVKRIFPHQLKLVHSRSFISSIVGGYGSGKSYALGFCQIDWMQRESPMSPTVACAPTFKQLDQATLKNLKKLLSECDIDFIHGSQPPASWNVPLRRFYRKWTDIISLETGHIIVCASLDEPDSLRGPEFGQALMDELAFCPTDDGFDVIQSRMRCGYTTNHRIRIATSPPKFPNWFYKAFGNPATRNQAYEVIHATTLDNVELPPEYKNRLKENYDDIKYRRDVLGQWIFGGGGLVYTEFDFEKHIQPWEYNPHLELHIGADFNRAPLAWVVCQIDPNDDCIHQFDEIFIERDATTQEACEIVRAKWKEQTIYVYPDASCSQMRTASATGSISDLTIMEDHDFQPIMAGFHNPPIVDRVEAVQTRFRNNGYLIDPRCKNTLESLANTTYIDGTRKPKKCKDPGEIGEHPTDALGYLVYAYEMASGGITRLAYS